MRTVTIHVASLAPPGAAALASLPVMRMASISAKPILVPSGVLIYVNAKVRIVQTVVMKCT